MLHRETLAPSTLGLLIELSQHPALAAFSLVGGTSLALRFGHRRSIDLHWFTEAPFDSDALAAELRRQYRFEAKRIMSHCLAGQLEGIRVDFVLYRCPLVEPPEMIEGIRMASLADVVPMKLGAIANRGAKKDFHDAHMLIQQFGLPAMLTMYQRKFPDNDPAIVLRSLAYFEDAEGTEAPESLTKITWPRVKQFIATEVKKLLC